MSGFSEQRQKIRQALVGAGIPDDSATLIANILGNSAQEMFHGGQITHDTTPKDLRQVDADKRRHRFTNLDPKHADPDHRRQRVAPSEEKPEPQAEPNVKVTLVPQVTDAMFGVVPGPMMEVRGDARTAQVGLRHTVNAQPPGGLPLAMLDVPGNAVVGKSPRAIIGPPDGTVRFDVRQNNREVVFDLQMLNRADYDVVTGVRFVEGRGLEVQYARIKAWNEQNQRTEVIPTVEQTVVSDIVEDKDGQRGLRKIIPVFSAGGAPHAFFNSYRIGRFTGAWGLGEEREIEQVFPEGGVNVLVTNLTSPVAASETEKYVLFAPRTQDKVPAGSESDRPIPTDADGDRVPTPRSDIFGNIQYPADTPPTKYYAIEIQLANNTSNLDCNLFASLNGMRVEDLLGFAPVTDAPQFLGHASAPPYCIQWYDNTPVSVLVGLSLTEYGIEGVFQPIAAYSLGEQFTELLIPTTDCATPGGGGG